MHARATPRLSKPLIPSLSWFLVSLSFPQHITEFLQWAPVELRLLPQIGRQEAIRVAYSHEGSLQRVLECLCRAGRGGVDILDTCELQETLDGWGSDEAGTAGCRDELVTGQYLITNRGRSHGTYSNSDGATLAALLRR